MSDKSVGRLERVELRDIWISEASDFTPWLARSENLAILADTIGTELELEAQEQSVGQFRADILCKDTQRESWVLIENQLEPTNHAHLGQLLTYAAGLQTVTIVWIAANFNEEHRAALDWLNEITDSRFRFFGLEVELWRIGQSPAAPRFNVISKPNDWTQSIGRAVRRIDEEPSPIKAQQLRYWRALNALLEVRAPNISRQARRLPPGTYAVFGIGRAGFQLTAKVHTMKRFIGSELFINSRDAKVAFALLKEQRANIEKIAGEPLSWEEMLHAKGCRIALYKNDVDPTDETDWGSQHAWLADALTRLDTAFRPRVRALNLAEARGSAEPTDG